jgi:hypothetical protein
MIKLFGTENFTATQGIGKKKKSTPEIFRAVWYNRSGRVEPEER